MKHTISVVLIVALVAGCITTGDQTPAQRLALLTGALDIAEALIAPVDPTPEERDKYERELGRYIKAVRAALILLIQFNDPIPEDVRARVTALGVDMQAVRMEAFTEPSS